eukprot:3490864-Rhodomonas_salina.3
MSMADPSSHSNPQQVCSPCVGTLNHGFGSVDVELWHAVAPRQMENEVKASHLHLNVDVDFKTCTISGSVEFEIEVQHPPILVCPSQAGVFLPALRCCHAGARGGSNRTCARYSRSHHQEDRRRRSAPLFKLNPSHSRPAALILTPGVCCCSAGVDVEFKLGEPDEIFGSALSVHAMPLHSQLRDLHATSLLRR